MLVDRQIIDYDVQFKEINYEYEKFNKQDFDNGVHKSDQDLRFLASCQHHLEEQEG